MEGQIPLLIDPLIRMKEYIPRIVKQTKSSLEHYSAKERLDWIKQMKQDGDRMNGMQSYISALNYYFRAISGYCFSKKEKDELTKWVTTNLD